MNIFVHAACPSLHTAQFKSSLQVSSHREYINVFSKKISDSHLERGASRSLLRLPCASCSCPETVLRGSVRGDALERNSFVALCLQHRLHLQRLSFIEESGRTRCRGPHSHFLAFCRIRIFWRRISFDDESGRTRREGPLSDGKDRTQDAEQA